MKRKREDERAKFFFQRSTKFFWSKFVELRVKVHLLNESYARIPKRRGFIEDSNEEISGNKKFLSKEASYPCCYASRGRDSSYLRLFPP